MRIVISNANNGRKTIFKLTVGTLLTVKEIEIDFRTLNTYKLEENNSVRFLNT